MTGCEDRTAAAAFARRPRSAPPPFDTTEIPVAAPPQWVRPAGGQALVALLPAVVAVAMVPMMVIGYRTGASGPRGQAFLAFPLMMLLSVTATVLVRRGHRPGCDVDADREEYLVYLADLHEVVTNAAAGQRVALNHCHPPPEALWTLVGGSRMWERGIADSDFGLVRIGLGEVPRAGPLVAPRTGPGERVDPVTATALRRFLDVHGVLPDAPVGLALFEYSAVTLDGDHRQARGLLRAMICQLAVLHGPDLVLVAAVVGEHSREYWDWLKWLPHHQHPTAVDGAGPARMTYPSLTAAETALAAKGVGRRLLLVVDGGVVAGTERIVAGGGTADTTIVGIGSGSGGSAVGPRLRVTATTLTVRRPDGQESSVRPDRLDPGDALVCARRLAGYRVDDMAAGAGLRWADLVGIGDVTHFDPNSLWRQVNPAERLRVPIGVAASGQIVHLDIKEAAENGSGPHGLCIGATGSGKSEFLRTLALGMMARHPPETLNLVLVDFKGGATFLGMERAPHVAAVITNLAEEAPLVERMRDALAGELNRRQELLRSAGNFVSAAAYSDARRAGVPLVALPSLLVIVDEFSELLSQHPDFADMFVAIGRLGRSLGVHLLLASQRLDEGRLRGLEAHLSYRVCLKTLSASESRIVLGVADAYQLPADPGLGYLRCANDELVCFRTAFVSGPCPEAPRSGAEPRWPVRLFTTATDGLVSAAGSATGTGRSVLQAVLDRLAGQGPAARRVWLPPLGDSPTLGSLLEDASDRAGLVVPIGIVDVPLEQCHSPLMVDLRGPAGNVAVVGAPQAGKSTALATLIGALAAGHDAGRVQVYCLDFGGGVLGSLRSLPQVGSVAGPAEPELVCRTVAVMESIVELREDRFRTHGVASMSRYRQLQADRDPACVGDRFGDVFLVVDGWAALCREFGALEPSIVALAGRGLSFGVHVVVSASRWAEIRPGLRDQIGTRIELRLGDPADSELDRRQARRVPRDAPGRGLTEGGRHSLIARPEGVDPMRGTAEAAPPVLVLPMLIHRNELVDTASGGRPVLGVGDREREIVTLDFQRQPHLLVLGAGQCGKTSVLRLLCRELVRTSTPARVQLMLVDYRRNLVGVVDSDHLGGYAASAVALGALLPRVLDRLAQRLPGPDVGRQQLRDRSWWSGPELYLVVDDYDLVVTAAGNPLSPLLEYLPHASDIGLRLVVARRSGGAARAVYEPLLAALRDLDCMGLMMSANPDDGPLIGSARPARLPAGRGTLVTRADGEQLLQVAWSPPP